MQQKLDMIQETCLQELARVSTGWQCALHSGLTSLLDLFGLGGKALWVNFWISESLSRERDKFLGLDYFLDLA